MWRRYGDAAYTLMTLAIFGFETIALGALSLSFLLGSASGIASTPVEGILLGIVISTASALLGLYLLSYHFISNMRDRWQADQLDQWTEWWVGLALTGPGEPGVNPSNRRRLPRVAVHSVLSLLEAVKGEEGDRLKEALASHGVDSWFLRRARSGPLTAKLDAIENLGKARLPQASTTCSTCSPSSWPSWPASPAPWARLSARGTGTAGSAPGPGPRTGSTGRTEAGRGAPGPARPGRPHGRTG